MYFLATTDIFFAVPWRCWLSRVSLYVNLKFFPSTKSDNNLFIYSLQQIAGSDERIYQVDDFDNLDGIITSLRKKLIKLTKNVVESKC